MTDAAPDLGHSHTQGQQSMTKTLQLTQGRRAAVVTSRDESPWQPPGPRPGVDDTPEKG